MNRSQTNDSHYVKYHGYEPDDFAEPGEITQFNGLRVVDESGSGIVEEFERPPQLIDSDWTINWSSAARLNDGTIIYEGSR